MAGKKPPEAVPPILSRRKGGEKYRDRAGRRPVELLEEALQLLRMAPAGTLAVYYLGGVPFILGILYFWAEMSRNPFAWRFCAPASLGLALLFVWMKCCQAVFCRRLSGQLRGHPLPGLNARRAVRLFAAQAFVQSTGLYVLPVAGLIAFPLVWVFTFYQNATVLGTEPGESVRELYRTAWKQARLWPRENHLAFAIMFLFSCIVFLNVVSAMVVAPQLLKTLLGIETVFSRIGFHLLDTTFLATALGLTYLCVDPLVKAAFTLRCFYGASIHTGDDLKVELAAIRSAGKTLAGALAVCLILGISGHASAAMPQPSVRQAETAVSGQELKQSIDEVINRREYTWRLPRDQAPEPEQEQGFLQTALKWTADKLRSGFRVLSRFLGRLYRWVSSLFPTPSPPDHKPGRGVNWPAVPNILLFLCLAILSSILAIFLWRTWRKHSAERIVSALSAAVPKPDPEDEAVRADDLPGGQWDLIARELMEKGEWRTALRAMYLATLARLAENSLLTIAVHKSNREYELELHRRTSGHQGITGLFHSSIGLVERFWYGSRQAGEADIRQFAAMQSEIMVGVSQFLLPVNGNDTAEGERS